MAEEISLASGGGMTDEAKAIKASVSERTWEAMIQVAMGKSIDEMGVALCISRKTVKNHVHALFTAVQDVLGWRPKDRAMLVAWAWRNRVVTPDAC